MLRNDAVWALCAPGFKEKEAWMNALVPLL
jgi:hypothetical protein